MASDNMADSYVERHIPRHVVDKLEAGAYRSLCQHLRDRSDQVQNIDLMTVSGFCRNCLAKWLVVEARQLAQQGVVDRDTAAALDAMGYDEAAQHVYGMQYKQWKSRHATKATDEQMDKYNASKPIWATHDKQLLQKKGQPPSTQLPAAVNADTARSSSSSSSNGDKQSPLQSNVCCQDLPESNKPNDAPTAQPVKKFRELPPYKPPAPPAKLITFSLGIVTVSDRAFQGQYDTGDLSGPAVEDAVRSTLAQLTDTAEADSCVSLSAVQKTVVPDDKLAIQNAIRLWSDDNADNSPTANTVDIILTTGGTGFAPRDVTPEATKEVLTHQCPGLIAFCTAETSKIQPMAALSRGTSGIRNRTFIANLPGNPKGVTEIVPYLLPLALHVLADIQP